MVARPAPDAPTCKHCGCYLASDDHEPVCSPCQLAYRDKVSSGYRPQHDPTLRAVVVCTLVEHTGERVNLYQAMGMWPAGFEEWWVVKHHVRHLRRHGHRIRGFHDGTYLYAGCSGS